MTFQRLFEHLQLIDSHLQAYVADASECSSWWSSLCSEAGDPPSGLGAKARLERVDPKFYFHVQVQKNAGFSQHLAVGTWV